MARSKGHAMPRISKEWAALVKEHDAAWSGYITAMNGIFRKVSAHKKPTDEQISDAASLKHSLHDVWERMDAFCDRNT
jgi:hypothetical protein